MLTQTLALAAGLAPLVAGHGYMTTPKSRTSQGVDAGTDTCPECTILEPVESWPNLDSAPVGKSGICGFNARVDTDYNFPDTKNGWGVDVVDTFAPGDIVDVVWCVDNNGDHGGMFTYRLCNDQSIVDKFLDPDNEPTEEDKQAAEECFQEGILDCNDVDGQTCDYSADCGDDGDCHRNDWFTCNAFDDSGCIGVDNAELNSCYTSIAGGYTVSKKVKIPEDFKESDHTLMSFKWNSYQTGQIYLSCADIAIKGSAKKEAANVRKAPKLRL
ncbi:hypothetical protein F4808DRAFT_215002 [Astrocystis sublimbata]|nr:hypothetical protein F4808DRAFT_215002 [Astrocystis sublimbata]